MDEFDRPKRANGDQARAYISYGPDYGVTGSRGWSDLADDEQDEYILSCFGGEAVRAAVEQRLALYDRAAESIAGHLLGIYFQHDVECGGGKYEPGTPRVAARVLQNRQVALAGTALGQRLDAAVARREGQDVDLQTVPPLEFYSVAPAAKGMEVLDEACSGDAQWIPPYGSALPRNDFAVLDRVHELIERSRARRGAGTSGKLSELEVFAPEFTSGNRTNLAQPLDDRPLPSSPRPPSPETAAPDTVWPILVPCVIGIAMLGWALNPSNPYAYYVLLRFVVSAMSVYIAVISLGRGWAFWTWAFGVAALVYNPLVPLHLGRDVWTTVNLMSIAQIAMFGCHVLYRKYRP